MPSDVAIKIRRGTNAAWIAANPVLAAGELGLNTDNNRLKVGNGTLAWNSLSYINIAPGDVNEATQDYIGAFLQNGTHDAIDVTYNDTLNTIAMSIDRDVVVDKTTTQTLTNKTISGLSNTLTNIGNSSLTNSSITINGSSVSLGGSLSINIPEATSIDAGSVYGSTNSSQKIVALGYEALNGFGSRNTAVGYQALKALSINADKNTAIGYKALTNSGYDVNNIAIGDQAMLIHNGGNQNIAIGNNALVNSTTGSQNIVLGTDAGQQTSTGTNTIIIGYGAESTSNSVSNQITLGNSSITRFRIPGLSINWDSTNVPIKISPATPSSFGTLKGLIDDVKENVVLGPASFNLTSTGVYNIAVGSAALTDNTTGDSNIAIGYTALNYNTTGSNNTAVGQQAIENGTAGEDNTAVGNNALNFGGNSNNTAIGSYALYSNESSNNTALGFYAGGNNTGSSNLFLGYYAGIYNTDGSNNIAIGNDAQISGVAVSNEITMGNASISKFRIPGLAVSWTTSAYGRATYASTSAPSGGNDGDVWLVYTA